MTQEQDHCGSQIIVCLAVKLLSELTNRDTTKHIYEVQIIHTIEFHPCCHGPRRPQHDNQ